MGTVLRGVIRLIIITTKRECEFETAELAVSYSQGFTWLHF